MPDVDQMSRVMLLVVLIACSTLYAQRTACPAIEVSIVADTPGKSNRMITADGRRIFLTEKPLVATADITGARASLTEGQYVLNVDVTPQAAKRVRVFSEHNVGRMMAFLVDGRLLRTPTIKDPITAPGFLIGAFERAEAERLADAINTGCKR